MNLLSSIFFEGVNFEDSFDFAFVFKSIVSRWYLYLALVLVIIGVVLFTIIKKPPVSNKLSKTQRLCYVSMFVALCTAVNVLELSTPLAHFSLVATLACVAGVLLGPLDGFASAFLGDLIGAIIAPKGIYSPIIGLGTSLLGLVPGLMFSYSKLKDFQKIIISFIITFVLTSFLLNTIGLSLIYPKVYVLTERLVSLPFTLIFHAVNCCLSILLIKVFKRILPKNKFFIDKV